jgi:hypothetical protein
MLLQDTQCCKTFQSFSMCIWFVLVQIIKIIRLIILVKIHTDIVDILNVKLHRVLKCFKLVNSCQFVLSTHVLWVGVTKVVGFIEITCFDNLMGSLFKHYVILFHGQFTYVFCAYDEIEKENNEF